MGNKPARNPKNQKKRPTRTGGYFIVGGDAKSSRIL